MSAPTKLDAMNIANAALSKAQQEGLALAGMYDPVTGEPTGQSNGAVETLVVTTIDESFDVEGQDGPGEAMRTIVKWFGDMSRELSAVEDALSDHVPEDD